MKIMVGFRITTMADLNLVILQIGSPWPFLLPGSLGKTQGKCTPVIREVASLIFGFLADRELLDRRVLLAGGIAFWSFATALAGFAPRPKGAHGGWGGGGGFPGGACRIRGRGKGEPGSGVGVVPVVWSWFPFLGLSKARHTFHLGVAEI